MTEFALDFYKLSIPFNQAHKGQIVIRTDGTPWKYSGFSSIPDKNDVPLSGVPDANSQGLYIMEIFFSEDGLKFSLNGVEVVDVGGQDLANEILSWDEAQFDMGLGFSRVLDTLMIQVCWAVDVP